MCGIAHHRIKKYMIGHISHGYKCGPDIAEIGDLFSKLCQLLL